MASKDVIAIKCNEMIKITGCGRISKNAQFSDEEMINKMKKTRDADCYEQR